MRVESLALKTRWARKSLFVIFRCEKAWFDLAMFLLKGKRTRRLPTDCFYCVLWLYLCSPCSCVIHSTRVPVLLIVLICLCY